MGFLRAKELIKINIWCHRSILGSFLDFLSERSIIHIVRDKRGGRPHHCVKLREACLEAENKLDRLIEVLKPLPHGKEIELEPLLEAAIDSVIRKVDEIYEEAYRVIEEARSRDEVEEKLREVRQEIHLMNGVKKIFSEAGVTSSLYAFKAELVELEAAREDVFITKLLEATGGKAIIIKVGTFKEGTNAYLVMYPTSFSRPVAEVARSEGVGIKTVPLTNFDEALRRLKEREKELLRREKELERDIETLRKRYGPEIVSLKEALTSLKVKLGIILGGSYFSSFHSITGWVPKEELSEFLKDVEKEFGDFVVIESLEAEEKPPTLIKPPRFFAPVQKIVNAYGLPEYGEINPAIVAWLTFPLFFGIMFGDVGQGLVLLAFALFSIFYLRKRVGGRGGLLGLIAEGGELLLICSLFSIAFGFVYGDFFGPERLRGIGFIHPLEYPHGTNYMMIFSLTVGAFHISLGLAIAVVNDYLARRYPDLLTMSLPQLIFYIFFSYPIVYKFFNPSWKLDIFSIYANPYMLAALAAPLLMIIIGGYFYPSREGGKSRELMELLVYAFETALESLSHTISYLRLWALSMAHEALMTAFISIAAPLYLSSPILALLVEACGNLLVLTLESLIVFMHDVRLHWVEWFMKFYKGTGYPFTPYREEKRWVKHARGLEPAEPLVASR